MSYPDPQASNQQPAANGVQYLPPLPQDQPAAKSDQGVVFLPPDPSDQVKYDTPDTADQSEQERFIAKKWYEVAGKALQAPAGGTSDQADERKAQAIDFFKNLKTPGVTQETGYAMGGNGKTAFGGVSKNEIPYVQHGLTSSEVTPEGWGEFARSTATPEVQAKHDAAFKQEFALTKTLEARQKLAEDAFKKAGGVPMKEGESDADVQKRSEGVMAAAKAVGDSGMPALTPNEMGQMLGRVNDASVKGGKNWFMDTTGDVAGSLVRSAASTVASPGNAILDIGSSISDQVNGPRALGESNVFSRARGASDVVYGPGGYVAQSTPALSGRADEGGVGGAVNWALTEVANAAPPLAIMLATGGASGPTMLVRTAAAVVGGAQSAQAFHDEVVRSAKERGLGDSAAEELGMKGMAVMAPIAAVVNYLPLHQILDKNPEIRSMIVRIASSAATNGAASTAQNIAEQLTRAGLTGQNFSVEELKNALESSLVVGGAAGVLPGHGKPKGPEKVAEAKPGETIQPAVAPQGKEFVPSFLEEGNKLPADQRLADNPEYMKQLADLQRRAAEPVPGTPTGPEPLQGQLPNETDLKTGKPEHPLVRILKDQSPDIQTVEESKAPDKAKEAAQILRDKGIEPVLVEGTNLPQGLTSKSVPGSALLDVNNPAESLIHVAAHEAAHLFQNSDSSVQADILDKLPAAEASSIKASYQDSYIKQEQRKGATPDQAKQAFDAYWKTEGDDELVASAIHKAVMEDGPSRRAFLGDKTLWGKIRDGVMRVVNSFSAKGQLRNEVASILRDRFLENPKQAGGDVSGNQLPGKNYYEVGHQAGGNTELWHTNESGEIEVTRGGAHNAKMVAAEFRGRIDHQRNEISIIGAEPSSHAQDVLVRKLEDKYPGYTIHAGGEVVSSGGGNFLPSLPNIRYEAKEPPLTEKLKGILNEFKGSPVHFKMTWMDKLKRGVQNDMWAMNKAAEQAKGRGNLTNLPPSADPDILFSVLRGGGEAHAEQRDTGMRDARNEVILDPQTKGPITTEWKLQPLVDAAKTHFGDSKKNQIDEMGRAAVSTLIAQSTLERAARPGTDLSKSVSGIGGTGIGHDDIKAANDFLTSMKAEKGWSDVEEAARRYRLWGDVVLQKLVDQGFITKIAARDMRGTNQFYANMQRVMDEAKLGDVYEGSAKLHKFRGSNRVIDNPYVNQDVTTDRVLKAAQENEARRSFVDLAGKYPDLATKVKETGKDTITVLRDGAPEHYSVDPDIKDALESFSKYHPEFLGGLLNTFGRIKRWGVTKVPSFILRNFTRDFQDRLFKGDSGVVDILHALDHDLISEMTAVGGSVQKSRAGSARMDYHKELSRRIKDMSSDKSTLLALPSKAWEGYSHLNDVSENANRVAEYNAAKAEAKRRGWSDYDASLYAASKSRGLIDFAVAGNVVRQINRVAYMAFLNGRLQGSYGDFAAAKKNPGKVALHALIMGTAPAIAAYAIASAQGKQEEYQALPMWRRVMFTNFYVGMGPVKWISVPKVPLGALFAAPVEYGIEKAAGRKDALKSIAMQGVNVFSPVDDPSVIPASFMLEGMTNYSFYYNRSIIPDWERTLPIERRNTEGSSNLGKMLSQITKAAGFQIDPRFIDNAVSRQFGGTGQLAELVSNLGSGKPMDTIGSFVSRTTGFTAETPGASSPDIANVYGRATEFYDESSPEIKQIAAFLKQGYTAKDRAGQDAAFSKARELAREVRKEYDDNGDRLKVIGKLNTDINKVQAEFKTLASFNDRLTWAKANPDKVKLLKSGESLDRIFSRVEELRKLKLKPDITPSTRSMADREIERLYSALVKLGESS